MRLFVVLVAFMLIFASCGSGPAVEGDVQQHAVPPRRGAQPVPQGEPVEKRATVKFADGSIDEYTVSEWDARGNLLVKQERFSASGQLVEEISYTYNEDNEQLTTKITKSDDNKIKSRVVYQYEGRNLVKESLVGRNGKLVSSYEYTYDRDGNMTSRIINNANGTRLTETVYNYQNGLVVSSVTKDNQGRPISSAENKYDSDGNLINQVVRNARNAISRTIRAEWQNGREVLNEQVGPNGQVQLRVTNTYGPAGELVQKVIENIEGQSTQILEYEYTFQQTRARSR